MPRRLLPALLLMVVVVVAFVATQSGGLPIDWAGLRSQALATVGYVANWQLLFAHQSYFDQFAVQSPLKHTWSLAIEEQFYLVWPLVIVGMMLLLRKLRRPGLWRGVGLFLTVGGGIASASWMAILWVHGASVDRVYYGTDTRAFDLLAGAALAMMTVRRPQPSARSVRRLHVFAVAAVGVLAACWITGGSPVTDVPRGWMFEGGFALCALAGAIVIADVRCNDRGPLGHVLSVRPVRYVGKISYGLYLWHWPVIVELTSARAHTSGFTLSALRVAVTFGLAVTSYYLVEQPIRHGWPKIRFSWPRVAMAPVAMAATALVILVGTVPPAVATARAGQVVRTVDSVPGAGGVVGRPIDLGRKVSPSRPLRILLVGDSVLLTEAPALEALFDSTHDAVVTNESNWGWGLTKWQNWATKLTEWLAQDRPDLIVAMWSWDNKAIATEPVAYRSRYRPVHADRSQPEDGAKGIIFQQFPEPGPSAALTTSSPDYRSQSCRTHRGLRRARPIAHGSVPWRGHVRPHRQARSCSTAALPPGCRPRGDPMLRRANGYESGRWTTSTSVPLVPRVTRRRSWRISHRCTSSGPRARTGRSDLGRRTSSATATRTADACPDDHP